MWTTASANEVTPPFPHPAVLLPFGRVEHLPDGLDEDSARLDHPIAFQAVEAVADEVPEVIVGEYREDDHGRP